MPSLRSRFVPSFSRPEAAGALQAGVGQLGRDCGTPPSCPTAFNPQTEQLKGFFKINPNHKDPSKPRPLSSSDLGSFNSITPPPFTFPSDIRQPEVDSAGFPPGLQTSEPQRRKAEGGGGGWTPAPSRRVEDTNA